MGAQDEPWYDADVRRLVDGRKVLLAGGVAVSWTPIVDRMRRLGAADVAVLATEGMGVGEAPACPTFVVDKPAGLDVMEQVRFGEAALRDLPAAVAAQVDQFDPERTALVRGHFLVAVPEVAGRPVLAYRRPEWIRLEDKTVVDDLWARAGVEAVPSTVVELERARSVSGDLDRGDGVVWAGDASHGWHGGTSLTEWVRDARDSAAAGDALAGRCRRVRVMPFLEGVPCSVHGIVCADGVVALRPVEMVVLRRGREFVYCGAGTFWDPPGEVRERMREIARRVGALLAAEVGFRGAFTVDGVVTAEGFRPTELNPRAGGGLMTIARGIADFPLFELLDLIVSGRGISRTAAELEAELLGAADGARFGGTWTMDPGIDVDLPERRLSFDGERWVAADLGGPTALAMGGQGFVRATFANWPQGSSIAPAAAAFYDWADRELGTRLGPLTPAPDVSAR